MGVKRKKDLNIPKDNSDFRRCYDMVEYGHVTLDELQAVKEQYPWFAPVVDNWKELSLLFEEELDKRLYMRIRQLCEESDAIRYEKKGELYYERNFWYNITKSNYSEMKGKTNMLTLDKFEEASEKVKEVTLETKLIYSDFLSDQTGNKVYLKPENMQFTGAYKVRGAYYKISTLTDEERAKGLITASAGNHAQGVAYAAKCYGCKAVIVMPTTTPLIKVNRTKSYGAEVVLYGDVYDEACAKAYELAEKEGYTFIHPFDDLAVATGQGTIAMEIFKELPLVEYILVPIGGGGLATGVSTLAKLLNPKIKVIGVEPAGANCMQESFKNGKVTTLPSVNTIADGTAVKTPGSNIFPYIKKNLDDIITVEDDELIVAFLDMVENHKMIVENSGLLTVAALKHLGVKDKRVVSILSGGNMDVITMSSVVQQGLIFRDRIFTVSVLLPDKPGELAKVSQTLADVQGNVIKLEHNQFVTTNRSAAVELRITLECFGTEHKEQIIAALEKKGYKPRIVRTMI